MIQTDVAISNDFAHFNNFETPVDASAHFLVSLFRGDIKVPSLAVDPINISNLEARGLLARLAEELEMLFPTTRLDRSLKEYDYPMDTLIREISVDSETGRIFLPAIEFELHHQTVQLRAVWPRSLILRISRHQAIVSVGSQADMTIWSLYG